VLIELVGTTLEADDRIGTVSLEVRHVDNLHKSTWIENFISPVVHSKLSC
jgi:hypothetical protein